MGYGNNNWKGKDKGGVKEYKADPMKSFMIAMGCSEDRAVELCCAGKIEVVDIPEYFYKLLLLRMGQVSLSAETDKEVIRAAARVKKIMEAKKVKAKEKVDPAATEELVDLCPACLYGPEGTGECPDIEQGLNKCPEFDSLKVDQDQTRRDNDLEELAANERLREAEEAERHAGEEEPPTAKASNTPERATVYKCGSCDREYKTLKGLQKHEEKEAQHG